MLAIGTIIVIWRGNLGSALEKTKTLRFIELFYRIRAALKIKKKI